MFQLPKREQFLAAPQLLVSLWAFSFGKPIQPHTSNKTFRIARIMNMVKSSTFLKKKGCRVRHQFEATVLYEPGLADCPKSYEMHELSHQTKLCF